MLMPLIRARFSNPIAVHSSSRGRGLLDSVDGFVSKGDRRSETRSEKVKMEFQPGILKALVVQVNFDAPLPDTQ